MVQKWVVVEPPAFFDGGLGRIVSDGTTDYAETWNGKAWVRGGCDISEVLKAPHASPERLAQLGVTQKDLLPPT